MKKIKRILSSAIAGFVLAIGIAIPAHANAFVLVKNDGGDRYVLIRGIYPDTSRYYTLTSGESRNAYYDPRKVWVPTGCILSKDGLYAWVHAIGRDGYWKGFSYQPSTVNFRVDCPYGGIGASPESGAPFPGAEEVP